MTRHGELDRPHVLSPNVQEIVEGCTGDERCDHHLQATTVRLWRMRYAKTQTKYNVGLLGK